MPLVRAQRLLNSIETGTTNAASLQALLANPGRRADLAVLFDMPQQARRAMVAQTTREAIFGSSLACSLFFISKNAIKAMLDFPQAKNHFSTHSTVMTNILTNSDATSSVLENEDFLSVVKTSIPSMNAIAASSTARTLIGVGLGTPTTAYNVLKSSHVAVAKMMAGHAGLNPVTYNTTRDLWNGTEAAVFTPLTNSKNAIRFALYSSLVGLIKGYNTTLVHPSFDSPINFSNNVNLYFLPLGWGSIPFGTVALNGTNKLGSTTVAPNSSDYSLNDLSAITFSKILAIAESNPANNLKTGRVQGTLTFETSLSGGVIGLITQ